MSLIPFEQITLDYIQDVLIDKQRPESEYLEYKRSLPGGEEVHSNWISKNKLGKVAVAKLAKEVVAFANARGGTIFVGISETEENPPRAEKINPVENLIELDKRLLQSIRDYTDPPILSLRSKPLLTDQDNGVLVIQIDKSEYAPHRVCRGDEKDFFIRSNDHSVPMDASQIKTLAVNRLSQKVEGFWIAKFGVPGEYEDGGSLVLIDNKLYGGDSDFFYTGQYNFDSENNQIKSFANIKSHSNRNFTTFQTNESSFPIYFEGTLANNRINGQMTKMSDPKITVTLVMMKASEL